MNRHGWGKYRKEGILELARIRSSKFFSGKDGLLLLIEKYIKIYERDKAPEFKVTGTTFYPELVEKAARKKAKKYLLEKVAEGQGKMSLLEKAAEDKATKLYLKQAERDKNLRSEFEKPGRYKTTRNIKNLRQHLEDFYKTEEGKQSEYRIYFVAEGDYRLGICRREDLPTVKEKSFEIIVYREKIRFPDWDPWKYRPVLFKVNIAVLFPLVLVLLIIVTSFMVAAGIARNFLYYFVGLLSFTLALPIGLAEISLVRFPKKKFVGLYSKYFLKLSKDETSFSLASYSSTCLECQGVVELEYSLIGWKGYVGRCNNNPDNHTYTFDHTTLIGRRR